MRAFNFAVLASLIFATPALAADFVPQTTGPTSYTWTGFYVGANVGGAWNDSKWSDFGGPEFNTNGSGAVYGGQIGYNYQIQQFVLGVEADFDGSSVKGDNQCSSTVGSVCRTKQDWLASVRGRAGYAFDRLLIYGTGGVAFTKYKFDQIVLLDQSWNGGSRTGWTAGLGAEYALSDHITAGVEWKYYDFGKKTGDGGISPPSIGFKETENSVIAKVNYKF